MHSRYASAALLVLAASAFLPACGSSSSSGTVPTGNADFTIVVSPTSSSVTIGVTRAFTAVARDANGNVLTGISFAWHSSDSTIAKSVGGGNFQGVAPGTAIITASAATITNSGTTISTVTSNQATLAVSVDALGTAAEGAPITGAVVSLRDAEGQLTAGGTDATGHFDLPVAGMTPPFLLKVQDAEGQSLYGYAPTSGGVNVDPYTDLLVRQWYTLKGADPAAGFAARAPLPDAADMKALDRMITGLLERALDEQGLDSARFSVLGTPFMADHSGFDRILDESRLDSGAGWIEFPVGGATVTARFGLDPPQGRLSWTTVQLLPGGSLSAQYSLRLPSTP